MSNTRHTDAPAPSRAERRRALNATPVPPSDDVAEANLAAVIGKAVAAHLGQLLQQMPWQPGCIVCVRQAKAAEQVYRVAVSNAQAAAEQVPEPPKVGFASAITIGSDGPVCWQHFEPGE